jgi:hypothetical protein
MVITNGKAKILRDKFALMPYHPPQISHEVTWDGNHGSAARSQLWLNQKCNKITQI